jgi:hypothetical protein
MRPDARLNLLAAIVRMAERAITQKWERPELLRQIAFYLRKAKP